MLDLLRKDIIRETLEAHKAEFINTDTVANGLWKKLIASSSLMQPIATFVRHKSDTTSEDKK